jgi:hypothetical protein
MKSIIFWDGFLLSLFLRHWRWRRYVPLKRRVTFNRLHGVISQKVMLFITPAVKNSSHTNKLNVLDVHHISPLLEYEKFRSTFCLYLVAMSLLCSLGWTVEWTLPLLYNRFCIPPFRAEDCTKTSSVDILFHCVRRLRTLFPFSAIVIENI